MRDPHVERIGLSVLVAALAGLDRVGEPALQVEASREAETFFAGLARMRGTPGYRGRLLVREAVPSAALVGLLLQAAAAYLVAAPGAGLDGEALAALGAECSRLAASIGAAMEAPQPADLGVVVQIDLDGRGRGELVLIGLTPEAREQARRHPEDEGNARGRRGGAR